MKRNIGKNDKIIRWVLAIIFAYLGYVYNAWWYLLTLILVFTAVSGFCLAYALMGINTCRIK